VVDNLFVFEGNAQIKNYPSNYSDYYQLKKEKEKEQKNLEKEAKSEKEKPEKEKARKLTFKEKQEFDALEKELHLLENEKNAIETALSSGTLSTQQIVEKSKRISDLIELIDEKEMRWLELSEI
jgi:ATP-binding cassette subfamily F protein uup